jgi:hypothetical protein
MRFGIYKSHRAAVGGIFTSFATVMIFDPLAKICGDAGVEFAVAAADDVDVPG